MTSHDASERNGPTPVGQMCNIGQTQHTFGDERTSPNRNCHLIRHILTNLAVLAGCLCIGYVALYPPRRERLHAVDTSNQTTQVEPFRSRRSDHTDLDREILRRSLAPAKCGIEIKLPDN